MTISTESTHLLTRTLSGSWEGDNMTVRPYGPIVTLAMTLNYVIGTGCFGLPFAFMQGGIGLCTSFMVLGALGALVTMNYTIESMARAEGVCAATKENAPRHKLTYRKFDFAMIADVFVGKWGKTVVQISMGLYAVGSLWSYASVFSSSMSSLFYSYIMDGHCDVYSAFPAQGCLDAYYFFMAIFASIVLSMVLMDISDQASVQNFLTVYRIVAFLLMTITMLVKLGVDGGELLVLRYNSIGLFNWSNFGNGFGPTFLALNCQFNMPDALQPLNPKSAARKVAFAALLIAGSFYLLVGLLGALVFDEINPLATLMWSTYSGCGNGWDECEHTNALGVIVQLVILLFPVVNVVSAYPMMGVTVGDNMLTIFSPSVTARFGESATRSFARLAVAAPPILFAIVFKRLDFIFAVAGLFGFLLSLSMPCWFQVISSRYCTRIWGFSDAAQTQFSLPWISSVNFSSAFLGFTFLMTAVAIATLNV